MVPSCWSAVVWLAETDESLIRRNLTPAQRARLIGKRKTAYDVHGRRASATKQGRKVSNRQLGGRFFHSRHSHQDRQPGADDPARRDPRQGARPRSWTMFQHVAYQSSGNGTSSQGPCSLLSFAATGLLGPRGLAANSSTSAALAALRSAHLKSFCMNKTPHRGTIKSAASFKNISVKRLGAIKYRASVANDRSVALSFLHPSRAAPLGVAVQPTVVPHSLSGVPPLNFPGGDHSP
jgi:hypothetical protein